jgi:hypothetical protein
MFFFLLQSERSRDVHLCPLHSAHLTINMQLCFDFCFTGMFFFLLQSEHGDLFKVTLVYDEDEVSDVCCQVGGASS